LYIIPHMGSESPFSNTATCSKLKVDCCTGGVMQYIGTKLDEVFAIQKLFSVHYFEFEKNYRFAGEAHDFWEFVYVDKGEAEVIAGTRRQPLRHGEMICHKPGEFHNILGNGMVAANIVIITFSCQSVHMDFFENKVIRICDQEKKLLSMIIKEAKAAFASRLDVVNLQRLKKRTDQSFGCEQLIKNYMEELLISLVRNEGIEGKNCLTKSNKEVLDDHMTMKIIDFLTSNRCQNITLTDVCHYCGLGKSNLQVLFKEKTGYTVMEYFRYLKIEEAKMMIRESDATFTELAYRLGYDSIHYFSRHFKKMTGMTPSEYALSVKIHT
jgi:AraC-like DNA-binding protein